MRPAKTARKPVANNVDLSDNLGLVGLVCRMMRSHGDFDEIRSAALRGLYYASRFHNPKLGAFSTYAVATMVGFVKTYRDREARFRFRKWGKGSRRLLLFSELGERYFTGNRNLFAVQPPEDSNSESLSTLIDILSKRPHRERVALTLRYGLDGNGERTLREVGESLGVSKERARQLIATAEMKLTTELKVKRKIAVDVVLGKRVP